jgi:transcriptional regulator with XRE-family HTH domain
MKPYAIRIKELREKHGMTQAELSKAIGSSSRSTISMYENGLREPDLETLEALADVFNVPLSYLMGENGNNGDLNEIRERLRRQPGMRILFDASKGATEQDLKDAAALIEGFKRRRDGEE